MLKEQWDQFIIEDKGSFLQSWTWGEFQESLNRKIWRLKIERLKGLVVKRNLPLGKGYLYCPRGPVGQVAEDNFQKFLAQVKRIGQTEKSIFFKIEPPVGASLLTTPFKESKDQIQPVKTLILDISQPEEELLAQMHQKTRYNIRLAQRKGVKIEISSGNYPQEVEKFLELSAATAKRDKFHLHSQTYYRKMMEFLGREGMIKLFLAKYQGRIIVANLICFFGQTATYLHGASDHNFRHLMAPHLCQWRAILEAKRLGCQHYDFWGIDEQRWPGVTRFKKGFNGQEVDYPGSFDLVFRPFWYRLYHLAKKFL
jgi:peptidoglycan pentaglycine glycine transferase (the first glycine)